MKNIVSYLKEVIEKRGFYTFLGLFSLIFLLAWPMSSFADPVVGAEWRIYVDTAILPVGYKKAPEQIPAITQTYDVDIWVTAHAQYKNPSPPAPENDWTSLTWEDWQQSHFLETNEPNMTMGGTVVDLIVNVPHLGENRDDSTFMSFVNYADFQLPLHLSHMDELKLLSGQVEATFETDGGESQSDSWVFWMNYDAMVGGEGADPGVNDHWVFTGGTISFRQSYYDQFESTPGILPDNGEVSLHLYQSGGDFELGGGIGSDAEPFAELEVTPEPTTMLILGPALLGIFGLVKKRRKS